MDVTNRDDVTRTIRLSRLLGLAAQIKITDGTFASVESLVASSLVDGQSQTCAAMVTHQADFPDSDHRRVMRADPAYQQIDMNNATLANPAELALSDKECTSLQQTLNSHFAEDGIRFEHRDTSRWFCQFDKLPDITTMPFSAAIGRDVAECRPTGDDARAWRSKLAEIEMLLFEHPVNTARQDIAVVSDNFYTASFASQLGLESVQPESIDDVSFKDKACMIVTDRFADLSTQQDNQKYSEALRWFEQSLCSVLWKNLKAGGWPEIIFWCGDDRLFRLQASDKNKFWRRAWFKPQPLTAFISDAEEALPLQQEIQQPDIHQKGLY